MVLRDMVAAISMAQISHLGCLHDATQEAVGGSREVAGRDQVAQDLPLGSEKDTVLACWLEERVHPHIWNQLHILSDTSPFFPHKLRNAVSWEQGGEELRNFQRRTLVAFHSFPNDSVFLWHHMKERYCLHNDLLNTYLLKTSLL